MTTHHFFGLRKWSIPVTTGLLPENDIRAALGKLGTDRTFSNLHSSKNGGMFDLVTQFSGSVVTAAQLL
jgi:hypothetical protein